MDGDRASRLTEDQIREELSRVLAGHEFRASKRSQDFLRFVTEHTLQGRADMLKERTIGIEVFGRSTSYEPSDDATVRVKAGEVRKRLGIYYSGEGSRNPLRIELPSGTYVPEFHPAAAEQAVVEPAPAGGGGEIGGGGAGVRGRHAQARAVEAHGAGIGGDRRDGSGRMVGNAHGGYAPG
jgi:hypothetical protein